MGLCQSDSDEEVEVSEIHSLYTTFMKECPSEALHLIEFHRIFGLQSSSEDEVLCMKTIFQSFDQNKIICKLKKKNTDMIADEECDRVFKLVDLNKDDQISLSEFMLGAQKDAWLMDLLKLDVMAHSWFRHNWKKKK